MQSHDIYQDAWIKVRKDDVIRPDGNPGTYTVVDLKPGVTVLALDDERNAFLTEEFHYGVGRVTIEGVSGGVEPGEEPLLAAQRELREEVGIEADSWDHLGSLDPFTSNVISPTQIFLARRLRFVGDEPEGTEVIRRVKVPFAQALEMVMTSQITHSASCIAILKAWQLLQ